MSDLRRTAVREVDELQPRGTGAWVLLIRVVTVLFGLLQLFLVLRVLLLLLGADQSNTIVNDIYLGTNGFVEPFRGIFAFDAIPTSGKSFLDVAAIVALVGWTIVEGIVLAVLRILE
jgi:hypothetical protein